MACPRSKKKCMSTPFIIWGLFSECFICCCMINLGKCLRDLTVMSGLTVGMSARIDEFQNSPYQINSSEFLLLKEPTRDRQPRRQRRWHNTYHWASINLKIENKKTFSWKQRGSCWPSGLPDLIEPNKKVLFSKEKKFGQINSTQFRQTFNKLVIIITHWMGSKQATQAMVLFSPCSKMAAIFNIL